MSQLNAAPNPLPTTRQLPFFVAAWVRDVRMACLAGNKPEVIAKMAEMPAAAWQEPSALRALITPVGRLDLRWVQLRLWLGLVSLPDAIDDDHLARLLRVCADTVTTRNRNGPSTPAEKKAFFDQFITYCLSRDLSRRSCTDLLKICAYCDPRAADNRLAQIFEKTHEVLMPNHLEALVAASTQFRQGWLVALYGYSLRHKRFETGEWAARHIFKASPTAASQFRLCDVLLRRGDVRNVLTQIAAGILDGLDITLVKQIVKRLLTLNIAFSKIARLMSTEVAVTLFLDWAINSEEYPARLTLIDVICERSPEQIYFECARFIACTGSVGGQALLELARLLSNKNTTGFRVAEVLVPLSSGQWAQAHVTMAKQGSTSVDLVRFAATQVVGQVLPWHALVSGLLKSPPVVSSTEIDAVISFRAISPRRRSAGALMRDGGLHIRWGATTAQERMDGVLEINDIGSVHNSEQDFASARLSSEVAGYATPYLVTQPGNPFQRAYCDETIGLCLDDRLFSGVKARAALLEQLRARNVKRVSILGTINRLLHSVELAHFLTVLGFEVVWGLDYALPQGWNVLVEAFADPLKDSEACVLALAQFELGEGETDPLALPDEHEASRKDRLGKTLIVCSLSDPSYFTASVALCRSLLAEGDFDVYNGGGGGSFAFATRTGFTPIELDEDSDNSAVLSVENAIRYCFDRLAKYRDDNPLRPWFVGSISRLLSAGRVGLALDRAHDIRIRKALGDARRLITIPGRMTCARSATLRARSAGMPTLDVQAFFISAHPRYRPSLADAYCAITQDQLDIYRAKVPPSWQRLVRVGSLVIDENLRNLSARMSEISPREEHAIKHVIYCAQHGEGEDSDEAMRFMMEAVRVSLASRLTIKLHPRSPISAVETVQRLIGKEYTDLVNVQRDGNIYDIIANANLIVTRYSNVGLEAAVLGRPVLSINTTGADYVVDLHTMGLAERADSQDTATEFTRRLLFDVDFQADHRARQEAYFRRNPELRSNRTADNIINVLNSLSV